MKFKIAIIAAAAAVSSSAFAAGFFKVVHPEDASFVNTAKTTATANAESVPAVAVAIGDGQASAKRLPKPEQERLAAAQRWERSGAADALIGQNGSIEYPYNYSRPKIACAPLHVCTIILQDGEAINSLSLGDTVRWLAQQTEAGDKPVIVVKPTQPGISTNMVVATDAGRVYYMHLIADAKQYVPIVSFYDPANMVQQQRSAEEIAAAKAAKREKETIGTFKAGFDPAKLDFAYKCKGNDRSLLPARIFASDTHTYIQMSEQMKAKDAPAVFAMRDDQTELVNMRIKGDYFVIDGKPEAIKMMVGVGNDQSAVTCQQK